MTDAEVIPLRGLAGVPGLTGDLLNAQRFLVANGRTVRYAPELNRGTSSRIGGRKIA